MTDALPLHKAAEINSNLETYRSMRFTSRPQDADSVLRLTTDFARDGLPDVRAHLAFGIERPRRCGQRLVDDDREAHRALHLCRELRSRLSTEALVELLDHRFIIGPDPETRRPASVIGHAQATVRSLTKTIGERL